MMGEGEAPQPANADNGDQPAAPPASLPEEPVKIEKEVKIKEPEGTAPAKVTLGDTTRHEHEAETILMKAIEEERQATAAKRAKSKINMNQLDAMEKVVGAQEIPAVTKKEDPSLAETAQYLMTLQEAGGSEPETFQDESPDLVDASATERITLTASLFKKAATFGKKKSSKSIDAGEEEEAGSPGSDRPEAAAATAGATGEDVESGSGSAHSRKTKYLSTFYAFPNTARKAMHKAVVASGQEWASLHDFFKPKRSNVWEVIFFWTWAVMLPCLGTAAILFYGVDNPPTGKCESGGLILNDTGNSTDPEEEIDPCSNAKASASWWLLFIGCRHVLIMLMARITDLLVVDWLVLQHPAIVRIIGARLALMMVQSKGWPSVWYWWGIWSAILLWGDGKFPNHWLYWQDTIEIFTDVNPSGNVTTADSYKALIILSIIIPLLVTLKRHFVGLHLGARLYLRYNDRLNETLKEVLLVSELSMWARRKRDDTETYQTYLEKKDTEDAEPSTFFDAFRHSGGSRQPGVSIKTTDTPIDEPSSTPTPVEDVDPAEDLVPSENFSTGGAAKSVHNSFAPGELIDFSQILEPWEEPSKANGDSVSGKHIIEFRQAFAIVTRTYFFSSAFGPVDTREQCMKSSELLFYRIMRLLNEGGQQSIDLNVVTDWMFHGCQNPQEKQSAEDLKELLGPDKDGRVYIVDFVGAIDKVYKKLRLLENAVENASHIDQSYEKVINVCFYFVIGCIVLAAFGASPLNFLASLGTILVSFGFMIGSGTSQLFEGVLLVLTRQPYDIGDKIAIANVDDPADLQGSMHWMVESIDLVTTVARLVGTNEVASFSNGSLARMRLINMNRSPDAIVYVYTRFATDIPYSTIMVFRSAVEKFIEDRPQEWIGMLGFRTNRVELEQNFVEYAIVMKHQNAWQNMVPILESKAAVASFCVEAQKQLGCRYQAPSMGIEITMAGVKAKETDQAGDEGEKEAKPKEDPLKRLMALAGMFGGKKED